MAKYFVMINGKFMTNINADSCAQAEHMILDHIPGTQSALAFDNETMLTDTFRGCLLSCEMISRDSLVARFADRRSANEAYKEALANAALAEIRLQEAREAVKAAEVAFDRATRAAQDAKNALNDYNQDLNIDPAQYISDF